MTGQAKDESVIELGDSVPAPLGFNAFGPECLFYAGKHWSGGQGSAGMRPERRLQRRNGGAAHSPPQNETQKTPPDISLLRAKNGLDNGVHLRHLHPGCSFGPPLMPQSGHFQTHRPGGRRCYSDVALPLPEEFQSCWPYQHPTQRW